MKNKSNFLDNNIIRWIVGIVVILHIFFLLSATYGVTESLDSLSETLAEFTVYEEEEKRIEEMLTEDGYEVNFNYISNYSANAPFFEWYDIEDDTICDENSEEICYSDKVGVHVEMKSLGSRSDQVWDVLTVLHVIYPNAFTYQIDILSPTDTCKYILFGDVMNEWFTNYDPEVRDLIQDYIERATCS